MTLVESKGSSLSIYSVNFYLNIRIEFYITLCEPTAAVRLK